MQLEDRFYRYVDRQPEDGCWLWTGSKDRQGYGQFSAGVRTKAGNTRPSPAHRVAYELVLGPIPVGLVIDHLCEVPACVRPGHLEAVTNAENLRRKWDRMRAGKCRNGHPWTPENTYAKADGSYRQCRRCHADYQNARSHAKKEAVA
jgi:hypothetical protein